MKTPRKDGRRAIPASGKPPRPRLIDVAQMAQVDVSIVSRALNDDPNLVIAPATRARILNAARVLNYRPNAYARGLRQAQTMTLGLLVPEVASFVFAELIHGVEQRAYESGYVLLLANAHDAVKVRDVYRRLVLERRIDGLLVTSATDEERPPFDLQDHSAPVIWVNRRGASGPSILEDDEAGMRAAVHHLADLGHTAIAHIAGPQHLDTARRRLKGYQQAMAARGLALHDAHIVAGPFTEQGGAQAVERLLAAETAPTAVTVSNLSASIGALGMVRRRGLDVPGDLSLVAFHDAPIASHLDPPLTTVQMPLRELGERAVDELLRLLKGDTLPEITIIDTPPRVVVRASTAPPARNDRMQTGKF